LLDAAITSVGETDIDEKIATLLPSKLFSPALKLDVEGIADAEKQ
jgi:hypothetical protein